MSIVYRRLLSWGLIALFIIVSLVIQLNTLINGDASWLIEVARRLLAGQHYYTHIFEVNPPLAPLLYSPCLAITKLFSLSLRQAFTYYLFVFLGACFLVARLALIKLNRQQAIPYYTLLTGIAFVEFLLFTYSFSEREQLMLALTLPYLITAIHRLIYWESSQAKLALASPYLVLVGLMAGLGFCLKPYFFVTFILVELYILYQRRSLFACLRIESVLPVAFGACYVLLTWVLFPNYLFKVVPLSQKLYIPYYNLSWIKLVGNSFTYYSAVVLTLSLYPRKANLPKPIYRILALALVGFYLAYLLQFKPWYYHKLPGTSIGILLLLLFCREALYNFAKKQHYLFSFALLLFSVYFLMHPINIAVHRANQMLIKSYSPHSLANRLAKFINQHHYHGYILDMAPTMAPATYLTELTPLKYGSRYGNATILLVGILHLEQQTQQPKYLAAAKQYFLNSIEQDLKHYQPCYILVDVGRHKKYFGKLNVNLLAYLRQSKPLDKLLTNYHKVVAYGHFALYAPPHTLQHA